MGQSLPPEDVFMGRGKSPWYSLLRTSIRDEDQTEFHSICFGAFPGGGGEKRLEVLARFQGQFHSVFYYENPSWVDGTYILGHQARFISSHMAVHTRFLYFFGGGGSVFFRVLFAGVDAPFPAF